MSVWDRIQNHNSPKPERVRTPFPQEARKNEAFSPSSSPARRPRINERVLYSKARFGISVSDVPHESPPQRRNYSSESQETSSSCTTPVSHSRDRFDFADLKNLHITVKNDRSLGSPDYDSSDSQGTSMSTSPQHHTPPIIDEPVKQRGKTTFVDSSTFAFTGAAVWRTEKPMLTHLLSNIGKLEKKMFIQLLILVPTHQAACAVQMALIHEEVAEPHEIAFCSTGNGCSMDRCIRHLSSDREIAVGTINVVHALIASGRFDASSIKECMIVDPQGIRDFAPRDFARLPLILRRLPPAASAHFALYDVMEEGLLDAVLPIFRKTTIAIVRLSVSNLDSVSGHKFPQMATDPIKAAMGICPSEGGTLVIYTNFKEKVQIVQRIQALRQDEEMNSSGRLHVASLDASIDAVPNAEILVTCDSLLMESEHWAIQLEVPPREKETAFFSRICAPNVAKAWSIWRSGKATSSNRWTDFSPIVNAFKKAHEMVAPAALPSSPVPSALPLPSSSPPLLFPFPPPPLYTPIQFPFPPPSFPSSPLSAVHFPFPPPPFPSSPRFPLSSSISSSLHTPPFSIRIATVPNSSPELPSAPPLVSSSPLMSPISSPIPSVSSSPLLSPVPPPVLSSPLQSPIPSSDSSSPLTSSISSSFSTSSLHSLPSPAPFRPAIFRSQSMSTISSQGTPIC